MWDDLQKVHEHANMSNKLYLMRKLYQTKLKPNQDMQNYIRSMLEGATTHSRLRAALTDWLEMVNQSINQSEFSETKPVKVTVANGQYMVTPPPSPSYTIYWPFATVTFTGLVSLNSVKKLWSLVIWLVAPESMYHP